MIVPMKPDYFDIHSHLNFPQFNEDRREIIRTLKQENIWTVCVGTNLETSREGVDLANRNSHLFAIIGLHPTEAEKGFDKGAFDELERHSHIVGIGEAGTRGPKKSL